jgi:beta-phosphoglucomutase
MLKAVIFDFDGVIVDSEPFHYQAFQQVLKPMGLGFSWEEYLAVYIGFDDRDAFREVHRRAEIALDPDQLQTLIELKARAFPLVVAGNAIPYPGVVACITELRQFIPLALCSGALRSDIEPILQQCGLTDAFSVMVTADDVHVSKPDPASYALTVRRLQERFPDMGITPAGCLAIEDTPAGIASANGAGIRVVAVTNSYPAEQLPAASLVVDSLAGISFQRLAAL